MKTLRLAQTGSGLLGALASLLLASTASADEPRKATEPKVLEEPGDVTTVVDAFDGDDLFDLSITLGYQHSRKHANIMRETWIKQPGLSSGGYTASTMNVAEYAESTSRLNTRLDVALYHDLALYLRMPIILSSSRDLSGLEGSENVQPVVLAGAPGEQLFALPFRSTDRSGIEYLAVGVDVNIMNQARDPIRPTWLFGLEARFNVSEPMRACGTATGLNQDGKQVKCSRPSDVNRNGIANDYAEQGVPLEGAKGGERDAGVSRGVTGLELHTIVSRRIKYVEPYGGFRALFEFPTGGSDFGEIDLQGSLVNHPPLEGSMIMGLQIIPWEKREQFQRVTFDARVAGTYRSEGRDYSELFDALGSSDALSIRRPSYASYQANTDATTAGESPSVVDPNSQKVYFTGLTDVQAHGTLKVSGAFSWQAGEFVKFQAGIGYTFVQPHFVTMDQPCNPDFQGSSGKAGPCRNAASQGPTFVVTGIPNPNYRPVINHVGRRFKVDDVSVVDLWFNGIVMF
ncbi:MAG: hypothetical protein MUF54_03595 [Polyangiaceae bacterium]|nr:hypothetical protein [Polyangiaceae bacterium]